VVDGEEAAVDGEAVVQAMHLLFSVSFKGLSLDRNDQVTNAIFLQPATQSPLAKSDDTDRAPKPSEKSENSSPAPTY